MVLPKLSVFRLKFNRQSTTETINSDITLLEIMAANAIQTIKTKVNEVLAKYPVIDGPLTKVAEKINIEKTYVVLGIVISVPVILMSLLSGGSLLMLVLNNLLLKLFSWMYSY